MDFLDGRYDDRDVEVSLIFDEARCLWSRARFPKDWYTLFVDAIDEDRGTHSLKVALPSFRCA